MTFRMNLATAAASLLLGAFTLFSCEQQEMITPDTPNTTVVTPPSSAGTCGDDVVVDFLAGQHIDIGDVTVNNDEDFLYVTVQTTGDWVLGHTHLYVGDVAGLPTNRSGNPQIGRFPYSTSHDPMVTSFTYTLPLTDFDSCFIIAFHAEAHRLDGNGEVVQSETGWADGDDITSGGSWATRFDYCKQSCCENEVQTYVLYGGQTIEVGEISVINDNDFVYVTYTTTGCWEIDETHLYVGDPAGIPVNRSNTPIPGQFPYSSTHPDGTTSYTYAVPLAGLPACYAIAAHASVSCNDGSDEEQSETAWSFGEEFPNTNRWGWYSEYCTQEVCDDNGVLN